MKIIHTGDWHIGKLVHGVHMTKDQEFILNELIELIKKEKPEVLIIAGDIYDRSIPPVEAVELLDKTLYQILIENNVKIIAIAGNHDSPNRISFGNKVFSSQGLHLAGEIYDEIKPIEIDKFRFYPIPFAEPAVIKERFNEKSIRSHDDTMKFLLDKIELDDKYKNICIAHGFVTSSESIETSDSVRPLSIGGTEYIDVNYFEKFDYVALGHLHKPQKVKHDYIRYSGSLLKYSFSEVNQKKSVTIVEFDEKDEFKYRQVDLKVQRDLKVIEGTLDEIIADANENNEKIDDYIKVILTDKGNLIEPMAKLKQVFNNILKLERNRQFVIGKNSNSSAKGDFKKKDKIDLFEEFYNNISGDELNKDKKNIVLEILDEINKSKRRQ